MSDALHHSPLDARHRALGARMVPFGGWDMPLQYASVLEEHRACRTRAVVFDVSHLGTVECRGPGATDDEEGAARVRARGHRRRRCDLRAPGLPADPFRTFAAASVTVNKMK